MFYHKCIENFAQPDDPDLKEKVHKEIIKFNSQHLHLDLNNQISHKTITVEEPDHLDMKAVHHVHIDNLFKETQVAKIVAIFITSSRDYIQGGELKFGKWEAPAAVNNYGQSLVHDNNNTAPVYLNEQGSLIIFPAVEKFGTQSIVSGKLVFERFIVMGDNYK